MKWMRVVMAVSSGGLRGKLQSAAPRAARERQGDKRAGGDRRGADRERRTEAGEERGGRLGPAVSREDAGQDGDAEDAAELAHGGARAGRLTLLGGPHSGQQRGLDGREQAGGAEAD